MIKENLNIRKNDIINRRMFVIGAANILILAGIMGRLFSLQINENKKYLTLVNVVDFEKYIIGV